MFKKLLVIATLAAGLISTQASAAFVSTDWKVAGDKGAVLDTDTGVEWLNLDATRGWTLAQAIAETSDGGSLQGWRLPSSSEVAAMLTSFFEGHDISITGGAQIRTAGVDSIYVLFRNLFAAPSELQVTTFGRLYLDSGKEVFAGVSAHSTWKFAQFHGFTSTSTYQKSVFLVSDGGVTLSSINDPTLNINNPNAPINMADVSAPTGLAATSLLAFMLGFRRKKGIDYV